MDRSAWLKAAVSGAAVGAGVALALALGVTALELVENPGGIFRSEAGWRWDFVLETAASWFLPTLLPAAAGTSLLGLAVKRWRGRRD